PPLRQQRMTGLLPRDFGTLQRDGDREQPRGVVACLLVCPLAGWHRRQAGEGPGREPAEQPRLPVLRLVQERLEERRTGVEDRVGRDEARHFPVGVRLEHLAEALVAGDREALIEQEFPHGALWADLETRDVGGGEREDGGARRGAARTAE